MQFPLVQCESSQQAALREPSPGVQSAVAGVGAGVGEEVGGEVLGKIQIPHEVGLDEGAEVGDVVCGLNPKHVVHS